MPELIRTPLPTQMFCIVFVFPCFHLFLCTPGALALMLGAEYTCYVGRPDPSLAPLAPVVSSIDMPTPEDYTQPGVTWVDGEAKKKGRTVVCSGWNLLEQVRKSEQLPLKMWNVNNHTVT